MGGCQNYDAFLGTLNILCRIIIGTQKGTIILTIPHMGYSLNSTKGLKREFTERASKGDTGSLDYSSCNSITSILVLRISILLVIAINDALWLSSAALSPFVLCFLFGEYRLVHGHRYALFDQRAVGQAVTPKPAQDGTIWGLHMDSGTEHGNHRTNPKP